MSKPVQSFFIPPPSKPPSPSFASRIPWYDVFKIVGFTLIPCGISAAGWYVIAPSQGQNRWLSRVNRSYLWISSNPKHLAILEMLTVMPMGTALYLVTNQGTSSPDVKMALGCFGVTMISNLAGIGAFSRSKSTRCWICTSLLIAVSAGCTTYAFRKVDRIAGWLMVPFAAWMCHQALEIIVLHFKRNGNGP